MGEKSNSVPADFLPQANPRGPQSPHNASVLASSSLLPTLNTGTNPITLVSSTTTLLPGSGTSLTARAKVPIPRLRSSIAPRNQGRIPRACERCRQRKAKCSGDSPTCQQCEALSLTCVYTMASKEQIKRYGWQFAFGPRPQQQRNSFNSHHGIFYPLTKELNQNRITPDSWMASRRKHESTKSCWGRCSLLSRVIPRTGLKPY